MWLLLSPALLLAGIAGWRFGYALVLRRSALWRIPGEARVLALTFDDGPDPVGTPGVLDDLRAAGVHATFFVLGERAVAHPDLVRRMIAEGHEVEVHGWSHKNTVRLMRSTLVRDLAAARKAVQDAGGAAPTLYRPAYGVLAPAAASAAREVGLRPYLWTHWARDWKLRPPAAIHADLVRGLVPGSVLLLHDGENTGGQAQAVANMRQALRPFLAEAAAAGWTFTPLGALLRQPPPRNPKTTPTGS